MTDDNRRRDDEMSSTQTEHIRPTIRLWPQGRFSIRGVTSDHRMSWRDDRTITLSPEEHERALESLRLAGDLEQAEEAPVKADDRGPAASDDVSLEPPMEAIKSAPPSAPVVGEALVGLFCKRDMREAILGDLDEKFAELAERRGARFAKAWYWSQAGRSVLFFAVRWGRRLLELEAILRRIP